jgi:putative transcriptional regulator
MALINRFAHLLAEKGVTISDVARATGISRQTLHLWQSKEIMPRMSSEVIEILCRYFNCEVGELLLLDPPLKKEPAGEG